MKAIKRRYPVEDSIKKWMKNPKFVEACNALEPEYAVTRALIDARIKARMSQKDMAQKMKSAQSMIARMESGRQMPSTATLLKVAKATGTRLRIEFVEA